MKNSLPEVPVPNSVEQSEGQSPDSPFSMDRRGFMRTGAAVAAGSLAYATPKVASAQSGSTLSHAASNFGPINTAAFPPLDTVPGPIDVTAQDFCRGLEGIIGSMLNLNPGPQAALLAQIAAVETELIALNGALAIAELTNLRNQVVAVQADLNLAAGEFSLGVVTSFSQTILVQVDYLIALGPVNVLAVIWSFDNALILKLVPVTVILAQWFTVTITTQWMIYFHYFLFVLSIRFRLFPGPSISIDIFLLYVCICLGITITTQVRLCIIEVRNFLLLVAC